jgi:hypothetical protein
MAIQNIKSTHYTPLTSDFTFKKMLTNLILAQNLNVKIRLVNWQAVDLFNKS